MAQNVTTGRPESKAAAAVAILMGTVLLISTLMASNAAVPAIATSDNNLQNTLAQTLPQTVKHRDLVIDLGNGIQTNAQLTMPAIGNGSFPSVLLVHGSGPTDMNETAYGAKPFLQISQYLSERGFAVLRYDKRGIGANSQIIDQNVWGNVTFNDLKNDAARALNVLATQPEVDPNKITLIGHSEGTMIVPRVVLDLNNNTNNNNTGSTGNLTRVANIVLMGTVAQNLIHDIIHWQLVNRSVAYASQALEDVTSVDIDSQIVESQLRPQFEEFYQNVTSPDKCTQSCPWFMSHAELEPTLDIIGNVPQPTSILLMNGENDSQTTVEQAFLFEQKLNEVNHPDHTLITYPGLGHLFHPSPLEDTVYGPMPQYVLSDLHRWLTERTYGSQ